MKKGSDRASGAPRDDKQPGIVVLCVLTCVLAVAGCSLAPPHQAPPLPVASAYPADVGVPCGYRGVVRSGIRRSPRARNRLA